MWAEIDFENGTRRMRMAHMDSFTLGNISQPSRADQSPCGNRRWSDVNSNIPSNRRFSFTSSAITVQSGQLIGTTGRTGNVSGSGHLHFSVLQRSGSNWIAWANCCRYYAPFIQVISSNSRC